MVNRYSYDPYGNPVTTTEAVANPWRFAGGYRDSFSGYYKFGTRYYESGVGRWTQMDPIGNRGNYLYVGNNPVNFLDPDGLAKTRAFCPSWIHGAAKFAGVGGLVRGTYYFAKGNKRRGAREIGVTSWQLSAGSALAVLGKGSLKTLGKLSGVGTIGATVADIMCSAGAPRYYVGEDN